VQESNAMMRIRKVFLVLMMTLAAVLPKAAMADEVPNIFQMAFIILSTPVGMAINTLNSARERKEAARPRTAKEIEAEEKFKERVAVQQKKELKEASKLTNAAELPQCLSYLENNCGFDIELSYCWVRPAEIDSDWEHVDKFCADTGFVSTGSIAPGAKLLLIDRPYKRSYSPQYAANAAFKLKYMCYQENAQTARCIDNEQPKTAAVNPVKP
jgi:hypothetical protein